MAGSIASKIALACAAAGLTVLVTEGVLSLAFGRSLRPSAMQSYSGALGLGVRSTEESAGDHASVRRFTSFARPSPNPRIGFEIVPLEKVNIIDREVTVNMDGTRQRVGPEIANNALRVVILGDSVAFCIRLADEDTIASHLESMLDGVADPQGPDVACFTLAAPGWSSRNSTAALLDRIDALRPDVVVILPIDNDLGDTLAADVRGELTPAPDPLAAAPLLCAGFETAFGRLAELTQAFRAGAHIDPIPLRELGIVALNADLTPSSRGRYDAECAAIAKLGRVLSGRGARLYVQFYFEEGTEPAFTKVMRERLRRLDPRIPEIPGFRTAVPAVTLPDDAHPGSKGAQGLAYAIAAQLLADGVVRARPGATLPDLPSDVRAAAASPKSDTDVQREANAVRMERLAATSDSIDTANARGCCQVIGGLNPDATLRPDFLAVLKRSAPRLRIRVAALDPPPPSEVDLTVQILGKPVGTIHVPAMAKDPIELVVELDAEITDVFELRMRASDWWTRRWGPRNVIGCCRLLDITPVGQD